MTVAHSSSCCHSCGMSRSVMVPLVSLLAALRLLTEGLSPPPLLPFPSFPSLTSSPAVTQEPSPRATETVSAVSSRSLGLWTRARDASPP